MKTSIFLAELKRFGWEPSRTGKHQMLQNTAIQATRPLAIRHRDAHDIDPCICSVQAKNAGLLWDQRTQTARPNPSHPYYNQYLSAFSAQKAA